MTETAIQTESEIQEAAEPRYDVTTWDMELKQFTPQEGMVAPTQGITKWQIRTALRELKKGGYDCHRVRFSDGSYSSDFSVLVERSYP